MRDIAQHGTREKFWDDTNNSVLNEELKKNHQDRTSPHDLAIKMLER